MDEMQRMRFACLEQAVKIGEAGGDYTSLVQLASEFFDFVKDGATAKAEIDPAPGDEISF